jgi:hypothetical protein
MSTAEWAQLVPAVAGLLLAAAAYLRARAAHITARRAEAKADSSNGVETGQVGKSSG